MIIAHAQVDDQYYRIDHVHKNNDKCIYPFIIKDASGVYYLLYHDGITHCDNEDDRNDLIEYAIAIWPTFNPLVKIDSPITVSEIYKIHRFARDVGSNNVAGHVYVKMHGVIVYYNQSAQHK